MISIRIHDCANGFIVDIVDSEAKEGKEEQTKVYEFGSAAEMFEQLSYTLGVHDEVYQSTEEAPPSKDLTRTPTEDLI